MSDRADDQTTASELTAYVDGLDIITRWDAEAFTKRVLEALAAARAEGAREALARQNGCSHKFIDSKHCLKCGWKP